MPNPDVVLAPTAANRRESVEALDRLGEPRTTSGLSSRILSRLGLTTSPTCGLARAAAGKSQWLGDPTHLFS